MRFTHCEIKPGVTPSFLAKAVCPPMCSMASSNGVRHVSFMTAATIALLFVVCNSIAVSSQRNNLLASLYTMAKRRLPTHEELQAGRALAGALQRAGMTHSDLADKISKTPGLISQWVTAVARLPIERAEQVADLLDVKPSEICVAYRSLREHSRPQVREPRAAYPSAAYHPSVRRLADLIASGALSEQHVQIVMKTAEALAAESRRSKRSKAASNTTAALKKA